MLRTSDGESRFGVQSGGARTDRWSRGRAGSDNNPVSSDEDNSLDIFMTEKCRNDIVTVNEFFLCSTSDYDCNVSLY